MSEALPVFVADRPVEPPPMVHVEPSFTQRSSAGLSRPQEILEEIRLAEEDYKAGRVISAAESVRNMRRAIAKKV